MNTETDATNRVAVLVVHGVAAKVPNREFENLEAVTNLLTFQNEDMDGLLGLPACYQSKQQAKVQFPVDSLHRAPKTPVADAGTKYTDLLVKDFVSHFYQCTTRRNELTRTKKSEKSAPPQEVHIHEFFWADLSRPRSLGGLHSISAFLRLISSVCILGPKSLPRKDVTERAGQLSGFYRILYGVQVAITWMTLVYIPIVATAFLAGIVCLYLLTQSQQTIDAVVPFLAGLSGMIGFAVWCCAPGPEKNLARRAQKVFNSWLHRGICCTAASVLLGIIWFLLGDKFNLRSWFAVSYVVLSFLIAGFLVLRASSHRYHLQSWGSLLVLLLLVIIWFESRIKPLSSAVLYWTDWFFALYWYGWLAVCALNLCFWLSSGLCLLGKNLLGIKKDFVEHSRGLWTACIAGTVPMAMCMVVHLGFFKVLCLIFNVPGTKLNLPPDFILPALPTFINVLRDAKFTIGALTKALMIWQRFTEHPAVQYAYMFLVLTGALALCAALPSITAELSAKLRDCTHDGVSPALGRATSQMFDLLRLAGEMVQRYVVIAIPIVVLHVLHVRQIRHVWRVESLQHFLSPAYWSSWCWTGMTVLGMGFVISRALQEYHLKREGQREEEPVLLSKISMFAARLLIVAAYFSLPFFQEQINLTWLLSGSTLFVLAGVAFLFGPLLSVGVDVTSWMQEYPSVSTPRARIFERLIAMLAYLKANYSGVVIVAHSQGTMVVIEALRSFLVPGDRSGSFNMSLFTLGCPLRQLYATRFPWIYDWVGLTSPERIQNLQAPPQVGSWTNAYGAGDYVGRNLWRPDDKAFTQVQPANARWKNGQRTEFCLGPWAHVHYWDWQNLEVAKELDHLIEGLISLKPPSSDHTNGQQASQSRQVSIAGKP